MITIYHLRDDVDADMRFNVVTRDDPNVRVALVKRLLVSDTAYETVATVDGDDLETAFRVTQTRTVS